MGNLNSAAVTIAEKMVAAPPISALMASILAEGLMEMPPLGKNIRDTTKIGLFAHSTPQNFQYQEKTLLRCQATIFLL